MMSGNNVMKVFFRVEDFIFNLYTKRCLFIESLLWQRHSIGCSILVRSLLKIYAFKILMRMVKTEIAVHREPVPAGIV